MAKSIDEWLKTLPEETRRRARARADEMIREMFEGIPKDELDELLQPEEKLPEMPLTPREQLRKTVEERGGIGCGPAIKREPKR